MQFGGGGGGGGENKNLKKFGFFFECQEFFAHHFKKWCQCIFPNLDQNSVQIK